MGVAAYVGPPMMPKSRLVRCQYRLREDQIANVEQEAKRLALNTGADVVRLVLDEYFRMRPNQRARSLIEIRKKMEAERKRAFHG